MKKQTLSRKTISLFIAIAMLVTMILPITAFAAVPTITSILATDGGLLPGADAGDKLTINFNIDTDEAIIVLDTDIIVDSGTGTFGTGATYSWNDARTLEITLGANPIITTASSITIENNIIADITAPTDFVNQTFSAITGTFGIPPVSANFTATAICSNLSSNNGKADKIILVFDRPTNGTDIKSSLSLDLPNTIGTSPGSWDVTKTIYTIILNNTASIENGAKITFTRDDVLKDVSGAIILAISDVTIAGNFVGAGAVTTATAMTASIVKGSAKPYAQANDKIVVVFNAPTNGTNGTNTPNIIAKLSDKLVNSSAVWSADGTIYTITLGNTATITDADTFKYTTGDGLKNKNGNVDVGTISPVSLNGSFGIPIAPKASRALAIDVDGTAKTVGDKIIVSFDCKTNTPTGNALTGNLAGSTYQWTDSQTLQITLGAAAIANTGAIDLSALNIKDEFSLISATGVVGIALQGSFGNAVTPKVVRALVVDVDGTAKTMGDKIIVSFNCKTNVPVGNALTGILAGATYQWTDAQTLEVVVSSTAIAITDMIDLSVLGIKDEFALISATGVSGISLQGSFGKAIKPEVLKAVAVSVTGKATSTQGDKVVVAFNTHVNHSNITDLVVVSGGTLGTGFNYASNVTWNDSDVSGASVATVVLGYNPDITVGTGKTVLMFVGDIYDYTNSVKCTNSNYIAVKDGSFGISITPQIMSATIVKTSNIPTSQQGDKIVFVFTTSTNGVDNNHSPDIINILSNKFGTGATGIWSSNGTIYTVSLGTSPTITDGENITLQSSSILKDMYDINQVPTGTVTLKGSFGKTITPELLSATIIKDTLSPFAQQGDKIVLVFSAQTNKENIAGNLGDKLGTGAFGSWDNSGTIFTLTLGANPTVIDVDSITLQASNLKDIYGKVYIGTKTLPLQGTFGVKQIEIPKVVSIIGYSDSGKDYIIATFNIATNLDTLNIDDNFKKILKDDNIKLGNITTVTSTSTELKIELSSDSTICKGDKIDLSKLGILSKSGGVLDNDSIPTCDGYLVPVVKTVVAAGKNLSITFSSRTNGAKNLTGLSSLLGLGATAAWSVNNTVLTIALGQDYTITNNGYIVLNGLGIKDGFSSTYNVVGQYKITSGSFTSGILTVSKIIAQSNDKSSTNAKPGDVILVKFDSATNLNGQSIDALLNSTDIDAIITVADGNTKLGTGYTGTWVTYDTLKIILGSAPSIAIGDTITVQNVAFPNGQGAMGATPKPLSGSFDGREFVIANSGITLSGGTTGDYRIKFDVQNSLLNTSIVPTIVCVAYSGTTPVSINRLTIDIPNTATPIFDLSKSLNITQVKVYVFNDVFADIANNPDVLANTVVITRQ